MQMLTRDTFFNGHIALHQPKKGYRYSVDAVLLVHLTIEQPGTTILDLGTGCGVIPIMLAYRCPSRFVVGVELQAELATIARLNVKANQMEDRVRIIEKDMCQLGHEEIKKPFDLVVSNPPFRKVGSGRINADSQRALARHELKMDLETLLGTTRRFLKKAGRFCIIYPSTRSVDLLSAMRAAAIEPKFITMIHAGLSSPAKLIAVTGIKDGNPGLEIGSPLFLYNKNGTYTETVATMFSEKAYSSSVFITSPDLTLGKK